MGINSYDAIFYYIIVGACVPLAEFRSKILGGVFCVELDGGLLEQNVYQPVHKQRYKDSKDGRVTNFYHFQLACPSHSFPRKPEHFLTYPLPFSAYLLFRLKTLDFVAYLCSGSKCSGS